MATAIADGKKRVVLPAARPGDVFDVQARSDGEIVLVRLIRPPETTRRPSRAECLRRIAARPLRPRLTWQELRALTREP
jgi:hypothetical protein